MGLEVYSRAGFNSLRSQKNINDTMNYNTLKNIQRNERKHNHLSKIPSDFYKSSADYFRELESEDEIDVRRYRSALSCYSEIIEKRINKITRKAYFTALRTNRVFNKSVEKGNDYHPKNILGCEIPLFETVLKEYDRFYDERHYEYVEG